MPGHDWEAKYHNDSDFRFKVSMRRNKLLGLWAAEKLGREGEAADAYAKEVIKADFEEVGDEDVIRKLRADFDTAGIDINDEAIRLQLAAMQATAAEQLME